MSKNRWTIVGLMLFGAYAIQGFGCGGDDSAGPGPSDASTDRGSGGSVGTSTGTGGTSVADAAPGLGTACTADTDCAAGLTCRKSSDNLATDLGGWPDGVCTLDCTTDDPCVPYNGICLGVTMTTGICTERCEPGTLQGVVKCHNRKDEACVTNTSGLQPTSYCYPFCATDADCGTRKCDIASGLCLDMPSTTGGAIGASCMVDSDCLGQFCFHFVAGDGGPSPGFCSALCRLGTAEACGYRMGALDAGPPIGACLFSAQNAGIGDIGACAQLCDTTNDCSAKYPGWECVTDTAAVGALGHGYCALNGDAGP